jgi:hypothetical protein
MFIILICSNTVLLSVEYIVPVITSAAAGSELTNDVMICKCWSGKDVEGIRCGLF